MNSCFCGKKKTSQRKSLCEKRLGSPPLPFSSSLGAHLMLPKTLSAFQYPFTNRKECYMTTVSFAYTSVRKRTSWICSNDLSDPFFWSICAYLSVFTFRLFFPFLLRISKAFTFFFLEETWKTGFAVQLETKKEENLSLLACSLILWIMHPHFSFNNNIEKEKAFSLN